MRTRDTEAGLRVTTWVATHPGKFTVAECAEGASVAPTTASGRLRSMLAIDPHLTLIRRGHYHYTGLPARPAGPAPLKIGDVLEVTGTCHGIDGGRVTRVAPRSPVHEVSFRNQWGSSVGFECNQPLWP